MEQTQCSEKIKVAMIDVSSKRTSRDGKYINTILLAWLLGSEQKKDWVAYRFITLHFPRIDEMFYFLNELREKNNLFSVQDAVSKHYFCASIEYEMEEGVHVFKKIDFDSGVSWSEGYFGYNA